MNDSVDNIVIKAGNTVYNVGPFLGRGTFGKCFVVMNTRDSQFYAAKIIEKEFQEKYKATNVLQEIEIHRRLNHENIVKLYEFFEDCKYIYTILELCKNRSLLEMYKRRKVLTEPEVRYFMLQVLAAIGYLHQQNIIHRDLKLSNLYISDGMRIKLGDFGLATFYRDNRRRVTACGTPNYVAPEIVSGQGHGSEADVWSIGCICYTLLVGSCPFEAGSLKDTYLRIRSCLYTIPQHINKQAADMLRRTLVLGPQDRPTVNELAQDDFFHTGFTPRDLPPMCLTTAPRFAPVCNRLRFCTCGEVDEPWLLLKKLRSLLGDFLKAKPSTQPEPRQDLAESPSLQPVLWVRSWIDHSEKYCFAYRYNDGSVGLSLIDLTNIVLLANGFNVHYVDALGNEQYFTVNEHPDSVAVKVQLLLRFKVYLVGEAADHEGDPPKDSISRPPIMADWARYSNSVVMLQSTGTFQVNFLSDGVKVVLCPLLGAATFFDQQERSVTFDIANLANYGCNKEVEDRLASVLAKIDDMILKKQSSTACHNSLNKI